MMTPYTHIVQKLAINTIIHCTTWYVKQVIRCQSLIYELYLKLNTREIYILYYSDIFNKILTNIQQNLDKNRNLFLIEKHTNIRSNNQPFPFKHLKNLLACLHFDMSSDILFNKFLDLGWIMKSFSVEPGLNNEEFFSGTQIAWVCVAIVSKYFLGKW